MIYTIPNIGQEIGIIEEIENVRKKLRYSFSIPNRWAGFLRRNAFARAIQGSNSIEGFNVTTDDAIAAVDGDEPLDTRSEIWSEITGYRDAMTYVLQLASDPYFSWSEGLLKGLHFMMLKHDLRKRPGTWRSGTVFVRDERRGVNVYEGPPVDMVPSLISELMAALNEESVAHPMIRAAMGHLNLVMIHPFADGNGRMARVMQTLVLAREGILDPRFCGIEEYLGRNTQEYYEVLGSVGQGSWQPGNNAGVWVRFCLIAHFNQATTLLRRTLETERVWDELERLIMVCGLPDRVIYALSDAAFGHRVRNSGYRVTADITENLASRDLKSLVDAGLLIPAGEKRGRVYVGSAALRGIRERNREPQSIYKPSLLGH